MISMNPTRMARDVMAAEPLRVKASTTARQLARLLSESDISGAPVVNQEGVMLGVFSKTELLRPCSETAGDCSPVYLFEILFEQGSAISNEVTDAMTEPFVGDSAFIPQAPVTVTPDTPIATIASLMLDRRIHRVILVDAEMLPVVIITTLDLLGVAPQKYPGTRRGRVGPRGVSGTINNRSTP